MNYRLVKILIICVVAVTAGLKLRAWDGGGTADNPYLLRNATDINTLATNVNNGETYENKYFKVASDYSGGTITKSIGIKVNDNVYCFRGSFDGSNDTLDLNITKDGLSYEFTYLALFGYVGSDANIHDVIISGSVHGYYAGGVVGEVKAASSNVTISNCHNLATISAHSYYGMGGIVGRVDTNNGSEPCSNILIEKCSNTVNVVLRVPYSDVYYWNVGGIIGGANNTLINKCFNTGNITGSYGVGGIAGSINRGSTIQNSYNTGDILMTTKDDTFYGAGGIVGYISNSAPQSIVKNCYSIGNVSGTMSMCSGTPCLKDQAIGGIAGWNYDGQIINCYNGGVLSNSTASYIGGIVGRNQRVSQTTKVQNCYSINTAASNPYGHNVNSATCESSYMFTHVSYRSNYYIVGSTNTDILDVLNDWVGSNNTYLTWVNASSESDNKGMPKFYSCTPVSVTNFSVTDSGDRFVRVAWDNVSGVSYELHYGSDPSSMWLVSNPDNPFRAERLTNGRTYYFAIKPTGSGDYCVDNPLSDPPVSATPNCP